MKKVKAFLAAVMMLSAVGTAYTGSAVTAADDVTSAYEGYYMIRNVNSGLCLNVEGGSTENGTNVQQWGVAHQLAGRCINSHRKTSILFLKLYPLGTFLVNRNIDNRPPAMV